LEPTQNSKNTLARRAFATPGPRIREDSMATWPLKRLNIAHSHTEDWEIGKLRRAGLARVCSWREPLHSSFRPPFVRQVVTNTVVNEVHLCAGLTSHGVDR